MDEGMDFYREHILDHARISAIGDYFNRRFSIMKN